MDLRFNPPPNWPTQPAGWEPEPDWVPDPAWPPAPEGWQLWVPVRTVTQVQPLPPPPALPAQPPGPFGRGRRIRELETAYTSLVAEVMHLRGWINRLHGLDAVTLAAETEALRTRAAAEIAAGRASLDAEAERVRAGLRLETEQARQRLRKTEREIQQAETEAKRLRTAIVPLEETALLQEAGVYEYQHPLADSLQYKERLARLKESYQAMVRDGSAVRGRADWRVNGSAVEGKRMVRDVSKLMLRAYNAEADNCVRTVRPHRLAATVERLARTRESITRLGGSMGIRIGDGYHRQRVQEIQLTADHHARVEAEREQVRAQRDFEREKARLRKEQRRYRTALARLEAKGDAAGAAEIRARLDQVTDSISGMAEREANTQAGYVYATSDKEAS